MQKPKEQKNGKLKSAINLKGNKSRNPKQHKRDKKQKVSQPKSSKKFNPKSGRSKCHLEPKISKNIKGSENQVQVLTRKIAALQAAFSSGALGAQRWGPWGPTVHYAAW